MRPEKLQVTVAWRLRESWRAAALLGRVARHAATAEGFRCGDLSIAVVGDAAMRRLHAEHMNDPGPTDVLTFDLGTQRRAGRLDGEIIVCADVARRCAAATGGASIRDNPLREARRELALYVVHGVLHLAGYDDQRPADFRRMHAREDELLREMGIGAVFDAQRRPQ